MGRTNTKAIHYSSTHRAQLFLIKDSKPQKVIEPQVEAT